MNRTNRKEKRIPTRQDLDSWRHELRGFFESSLCEIHEVMRSLEECIEVSEDATSRSAVSVTKDSSRMSRPDFDTRASSETIDTARSRLESLKRQLAEKLQERPVEANLGASNSQQDVTKVGRTG